MKKSKKQLLKLGMDYIIQAILPPNNEELDQLSDEIIQLEKDELEFTLGVIGGAVRSLLKETKYANMSEKELRAINESSMAQLHIDDEDDDWKTVSIYCNICKTTFRSEKDFDNHDCKKEI